MRSTAERWFRRGPFLAAALAAVYLLLVLLTHTGGYLGTDTGAKVATLDRMAAGDTAVPDVGYWAEQWDPDGSVHPLFQVKPIGDSWVVVTTLPMLELGVPLFDLGGYRSTLILPVVGAVFAALAARALAQRLGGDPTMAFWVVGLGSPVAVYALDFWEHAPGAALMLWGVVAWLDWTRTRRPLLALAAGGAFGAAASLRTEALVYLTVATTVAVVAVVAAGRSHLRAAASGFGLAVVGAVVPLLANEVLERTVGGLSRASRAGGAAGGSGAITGDFSTRVEEAAVTTLSTRATVVPGVIIGVVLVLLIAWMLFRGTRAPRPAIIAGAVAVYIASFGRGLSFLAGFLPAFPLAVAGVLLFWSAGERARLLGLMAIVPLPLVWATQYTGAAGPQWGGRYLLTSSIVLGVVGLSALAARDRQLLIVLTALCVLVTSAGVAWLSLRGGEVERTFDRLVAMTEPVVIARPAFFVREGGDAYAARRWLTAIDDADVPEAFDVVAQAGFHEAALVDEEGRVGSEMTGWEIRGTEVFGYLDTELAITHYVRRGR